MNVIGRSFSSTTLAERTEEGDWRVTVTMNESRKVEDSEWEEKSLKSTFVDNSFEKAYATALNSVLEQFNEVLTKTKSDSMFEDEEVKNLPLIADEKSDLVN